jgi:NAD(P)-dependent dehydrogenase (short-subunit alcohol dehydrogenase family)
MGILDLFKLDGRVAVVTGGAKGIGMSYSTALAEAGAKVVIADIDSKAVSETAARGEEHPGRIMGADLDVTKRDSIEAMLKKVDDTWGRLDILVNNAALFTQIPPRQEAWGIPDDEFDRVMAVNVRGMYACTELSVPLMARNNWGRIVNISSGLAFKGMDRLVHYASSKGAVVTMTRSLAQGLAKNGINVNAIAPGATDSPTFLEVRQSRMPPGETYKPIRLEQRLIDRQEVPEDLLGTMVYLCSPASEFVTGQTILVDGGAVLH